MKTKNNNQKSYMEKISHELKVNSFIYKIYRWVKNLNHIKKKKGGD